MQDALKEKYGAITAISMVVGAVIGVGIFLRAPKMSLTAGGDTTAIILAWIVGAFMIIPIATIIAEVASMSNRSGGAQVYAEDTFGKRFGFGVGWAQSFFYIPGNLVFMLWLAAEYTIRVTNMQHVGVGGTVLLGLFYCISLFLLNLIFPKVGGMFQIIATGIKLIPLVLIGSVGLFYFGEKIDVLGPDPALAAQLAENAKYSFLTKVAVVIPAVLFALDGWIFVGIISKEVKNPGRNIPLAIVGGLLIISVLYLAFTIATFNVATAQSLGTKGAASPEVAAILFGNFFGGILNAFVLVSALGVSNANTLAIIRTPYALAQNNKFWGCETLSKINPKNNMPINSGILSMVLVVAYFVTPYFLGKAEGGNIYGFFIDSSLLLFFIFFIIICFGVIRLRKTKPNLARPFKAPFINVLMVMGVIGASIGVYGLITSYSFIPVICFILFACSGFLVYSFVKPQEQ